MHISIVRRVLSLGAVTSLIACGSDPTEPDPDSDQMLCGPAQSDGWLWVDVAQGTKPALSLAPDGTPHLTFMLESLQGWVAHTQIDPTGMPAATTTVAS